METLRSHQKIVRVGTSAAVIVSRPALKALKWREGNRVVVRVSSRGMVITRSANGSRT